MSQFFDGLQDPRFREILFNTHTYRWNNSTEVSQDQFAYVAVLTDSLHGC
jgi:hypothetical protein